MCLAPTIMCVQKLLLALLPYNSFLCRKRNYSVSSIFDLGCVRHLDHDISDIYNVQILTRLYVKYIYLMNNVFKNKHHVLFQKNMYFKLRMIDSMCVNIFDSYRLQPRLEIVLFHFCGHLILYWCVC